MALAAPIGAVDKARPILKGRPQKNVDHEALVRDIAARFPRIHAELAK